MIFIMKIHQFHWVKILYLKKSLLRNWLIKKFNFFNHVHQSIIEITLRINELTMDRGCWNSRDRGAMTAGAT